MRAGGAVAWSLAILWLIIIWVANSLPRDFFPDELATSGSADWWAHVLLYTPLGLLLTWAMLRPHWGCGGQFILALLAFTLGSGLAWLDEWHKQFIAGRHGQSIDLHLNLWAFSVGALIALLLGALNVFRRAHRLRYQRP